MKVINKKLVSVLCVLVVVLSIGMFFIYPKDTDKITLDEVKLKEPKKESGMFAIMLQKDSGSAEYEQSSVETFPKEGYTLNEEKSGCLDSDGQKITDVQLSYVDGKVKVDVENTSYCYIYFDLESPKSAAEYLKEQMHSGLTETPGKGDLTYRYVGTATDEPENYICFGTSSKCSISDNYMYRIIGIDNQNRLKIIKNKAMLSTKWHNDFSSNVKWDSSAPSSLYTSLNGTGFLTNTSTYVPSGWESKISETTWNIGDSKWDDGNGYGSNYTDTGDEVLAWESKATLTTPAKIGLMYLSDYYYSYDGSGSLNCYDNSTDYAKCKTSWLHISNSEISDQTGQHEWTMSRYGYNGIYYAAWYVNSSGNVNGYNLDDTYAVRPVFYLDSSVVLTGEGTKSNPFMIQM